VSFKHVRSTCIFYLLIIIKKMLETNIIKCFLHVKGHIHNSFRDRNEEFFFFPPTSYLKEISMDRYIDFTVKFLEFLLNP
jgi:hypothetical protein